MSDPRMERVNVGAYERPFSGVGVEFDPMGAMPGRTGIVLHEAGYLAGNSEWNFPGVFSPFWRLYYNAQRGHCVLFGERMVELTPEAMMLIPPRCLFHCLGGNPVETLWLAFSFGRRLGASAAVPVLLPPRDTELCLIRDLARRIEGDSGGGGGGREAIQRLAMAWLQVVLARPELDWEPPPPERLEQVRRYIEGHLAGHLSAASLARRAGLSVAGFNRAFGRHFGTSPARYVTEARVREAARMLLQGGETIELIAERAGFPNRAYFSRVFKQVTDESPAAFRKKHGRAG